jgi:isopenicillin N synthase-like dioxygenase
MITTPSSMALRTLDFSAFTTGPESQRSEFCSALLEAFQIHGFVKLIHHGLPQAAISEAFSWNRNFFSLPQDVKMEVSYPSNPHPLRGYSWVGQEKLSGATGYEKGVISTKIYFDAKESWDQGPSDDSLYRNRWLEESHLPGFRFFMENFFDRCYDVEVQILHALAVALSLPEDRLDQLHSQKENDLRFNHYPSIDISRLRDGGTNRISEHTDFGSITMLFQDSVGGLEIEDQNEMGMFRPVECVSGDGAEMIVNIGDSLQRLTNDLLRSASHRVTVPVNWKERTSGLVDERYSVAYFAKPNRAASLCPLPEFAHRHEPPRYADITVIEYNRQKSEKTW